MKISKKIIDKIINEEIIKLLEAKDEPQVGDTVDIVTSSYYTQKIVKVSGGYVVVDNKSGRGAPAIILGKDSYLSRNLTKKVRTYLYSPDLNDDKKKHEKTN